MGSNSVTVNIQSCLSLIEHYISNMYLFVCFVSIERSDLI